MAELKPEQWQAIETHIFAGRKIEAIKQYREAVPGTGLAEAKAAVEKMENDLRQVSPEKFAKRKSGCTGLLALLGLLGALALGLQLFLLTR